MAFGLFSKKQPSKPEKTPVKGNKAPVKKPDAPKAAVQPVVEEEGFSLDFTHYAEPAAAAPAAAPAAPAPAAAAPKPIPKIAGLDFDSLVGGLPVGSPTAEVAAAPEAVEAETPEESMGGDFSAFLEKAEAIVEAQPSPPTPPVAAPAPKQPPAPAAKAAPAAPAPVAPTAKAPVAAPTAPQAKAAAPVAPAQKAAPTPIAPVQAAPPAKPAAAAPAPAAPRAAPTPAPAASAPAPATPATKATPPAPKVAAAPVPAQEAAAPPEQKPIPASDTDDTVDFSRPLTFDFTPIAAPAVTPAKPAPTPAPTPAAKPAATPAAKATPAPVAAEAPAPAPVAKPKAAGPKTVAPKAAGPKSVEARAPVAKSPERAKPAAAKAPAKSVAPAQIEPSAPNSILIVEVESGKNEVPGVIEDAAMLFANDQAQEALEKLDKAIAAGKLATWNLPAWLMRFDLYQELGRKGEFEEKALDFVVKFERSPPAWVDAPEGSLASRPGSSTAVTLSGPLSAASAGAFTQLRKAAEKQPKLRVDFSKLESVDAPGCSLLLDTLKSMNAAKKEVYISGETQILELLREKAEPANPAVEQCVWLLLLEMYQTLGMGEEFEEAAIDYAVTYEVSPPSWEARPRAQSFIAPKPEASGVRVATDDSFRLHGEIAGQQDGLFRMLTDYSVKASPVLLDFAHTHRIDFVNAGRLAGIVEKAVEAGKPVVLRSAGEMTIALFAVLGLHKLARIIPRK